MNVTLLNPDSKGSFLHFIEAVIPLTIASICVVLVFRAKNYITELTALLTRRGTLHDHFRRT
jgi:hypothetical protein